MTNFCLIYIYMCVWLCVCNTAIRFSMKKHYRNINHYSNFRSSDMGTYICQVYQSSNSQEYKMSYKTELKVSKLNRRTICDGNENRGKFNAIFMHMRCSKKAWFCPYISITGFEHILMELPKG